MKLKRLLACLFTATLAVVLSLSALQSSVATDERAGQATQWWKTGRWYWLPEKSQAKWQHVVFRKRIVLAALPVNAPLGISADAVYRLHVNGRFVMQGPARSLRDCATVDELDAARWLGPGANVLAVEVACRPSGRWDAGYICQAPGLFCAIDLSHCPGAEQAEWRCLEPRAYDDATPLLGNRGAPVEIFDARKLDPAWTRRRSMTRSGRKPATWGRRACLRSHMESRMCRCPRCSGYRPSRSSASSAAAATWARKRATCWERARRRYRPPHAERGPAAGCRGRQSRMADPLARQ